MPDSQLAGRLGIGTKASSSGFAGGKKSIEKKINF